MGKLDEAIQALAKTKGHSFYHSELCVVTSVTINSEKKVISCEPINSDSEFGEVDLSAEYNNGLIIAPKVGSNIIIGFSAKVDPFVMMFSEIENIYLDVESDIIINGGNNGGVVKVQDLVNKLNNIENKVNSLVSFTQTHTHSGVQTGGGTSGVPVVPVTGSLTNTTVNDLANTKLKH